MRFSTVIASVIIGSMVMGGCNSAYTYQQTDNNPDNDWFQEAKVGAFMHFLVDEETADLVDKFDVQFLADQLEEAGVKVFELTLGQNSGYYIAPNPIYDEISGYKPGEKTSKRDIPMEMAKELKKRGIDFMLYLPGQAPFWDKQSIDNFGFVPFDRIGSDRDFTEEGVEKWAKVIAWWSDHYGDLVKGWWFDGCRDDMKFTEEAGTAYATAVKSGNPHAIVAFNPGVEPILRRQTKASDYTAGEVSDNLSSYTTEGRWIDGAQAHILTYLGKWWGGSGYDGCRFSDDELCAWTKRFTSDGGVVIFDVGPNFDESRGPIGRISDCQLRQLKLCVEAAQNPDEDTTDYCSYVEPFMGTAGQGCNGQIIPMAVRPNGMVQLAPDTSVEWTTGYRYTHDKILGFSHMHRSGGGGGSDFQDILFLPLQGDSMIGESLPEQIGIPFSHDKEHAEPGYYNVMLDGIECELTATRRCGLHRYTFPKGKSQNILVDLKHGNTTNCTTVSEDNFDTVRVASLELVGKQEIKGCRITNGWCPEMHVYFDAKFSKPIKSVRFYADGRLTDNTRSLEGRDVKALLTFGGDENEPLEAYVGISSADTHGAAKNLRNEVGSKDFKTVRAEAHKEWNSALSKIKLDDPTSEKGRTFYSCWYFAQVYPLLWSDVDGRYRGADVKVHKGETDNYSAFLGMWDIYRTQLPLIGMVRPDIISDVVKTLYAFYKEKGMLPIFPVGGQESNCMEGYHAMPVIANAYYNGVRDFDADKMLEAMRISACADTFGYFCRNFRGAKNYLKYHYIPWDKEVSSVSKVMEQCYDDWCIGRFAQMTGHDDVAAEYFDRSQWFRNVFDPQTGLMRPKGSDGSFIEPFDPVWSNHMQIDDHFMEGTSWHWTFAVQHDPYGLAGLMGGKDALAAKLDTLFFHMTPEVHGPHPSGDMTGSIGHYAHGNEPSHHTIYLYDFAGRPWMTQQLVGTVIDSLYHPDPDGLCGDEDTGQMAAWYVLSSMGFYPVTLATGIYCIGAPQHDRIVFKHAGGTLTIEAPGASEGKKYISSLSINGKSVDRCYLTRKELFEGDSTIKFGMSSTPTEWGQCDIPATE